MNNKGKDAFLRFWKEHKIRVIVYSSLLVVALGVAIALLQSTYEYVISDYNHDPANVQVCEDGVKTLSKMKYYRNSKNYIKQMTRSAVESYCESFEFDEAKRFLDTYYQEDMENLYSVIADKEAEYEEMKRIEYMESREGRTKRVQKMYETMGVGGIDYATDVPYELISRIKDATIEEVGYLFPVWNRNDTYLNMVKNTVFSIAGYHDSREFDNYYIDNCYVREDIDISAEDFEDYIRYTYDIDIDVERVFAVDFSIMQVMDSCAFGPRETMAVFVTRNKCFFGGFFRDTQNCSLKSLVPYDIQYDGSLADEYEKE